MMREKRLALGGVIFLVLLGATAWAVAARRAEVKEDSEVEATLPSISQNKLDEIEIYKDDEHVRLSKVNGAWAITAPIQAEADQEAVQSAVEKLTTLQVTGVAATHKDNHKVLEIDDKTGIRVIVKDKGKTLADLVLGASRSGHTMVREHGKDQVLSVAGSIKWSFAKDLKGWRDRKILELQTNAMARIDFEHGNTKIALVQKDGEWQLAPGTKSISEFSASNAASLASSVANLMATDFAADSVTAQEAGLDPAQGKVTVTMTGPEGSEGEKHAVFIGQKDPSNENQTYVQRSGKALIYLVTKYAAERLMPDAEALQKKKEDENAPPPSMPGAAAPGMPGAPGAGGQLPPEVMRQLQQQMQQQQMQR